MGNHANEHELIVCHNLPLRYWKIRRIRTAYDKKLRIVYQEYRRICNQIQNLGYEELIPPVRQGYKRLFVLTEDTKNSTRAEFYNSILEKINTVRYSRNKTFKEKKKRRVGKWKYNTLPAQELKEVYSSEFNREGMFSEEEKAFFYKIEYFNRSLRMYQTKYIFKEPWRFELRVKPHYITKVRRKDAVLEQQRDELAKLLDRDESQCRLVKMRGGNGYSWKKICNKRADRKRYAYCSVENRPLHSIADEFNHYKEEKEWI